MGDIQVENVSLIPIGFESFTGREKEISSFMNVYEKLSLDSSEVISFYGIGGVGKSTLQKKLEYEIANKKNSFFVTINFESIQTKEIILEELARQLHKCHAKYQFPLLTLALHGLLSKNDNNYYANNLLGNTLLLFKEVLKDISSIPVMIGLDFLEYTANNIKQIYKVAKKIHKEKSSPYIERISHSTQDELLRDLQFYFYTDIYPQLKNKHHKIVFFMDGYENYIDKRGQTFEEIGKDRWLYNPSEGYYPLIRLPNTLWVFFGREKLSWPSGYVKSTYELKDFSFDETELFLRRHNIINARLIDGLYQLTNGSPLFLNICVEHYLNIKKNKIPTIADFGKDTTQLLNRFLQKMSADKIEIINTLVFFPNTWQKDMALQVLNRKYNKNCSDVLDIVLSFSFVNMDSDGNYKLHKTFREIVRASLSSDSLISKTYVFDYITQEICNPKASRIMDSAEYYCQYLEEEGSPECVKIEDLYLIANQLELNSQATGFYKSTEKHLYKIVNYLAKQDSADELFFSIQNIRIENLERIGDYAYFEKEAYSNFINAQNKLGSNNLQTILAKRLLAISRGTLGHIATSKTLLESCYSQLSSKYPSHDENVLRVQTSLGIAYGKLGMINKDNSSEMKKYLDKSYEFFDKCYNIRSSNHSKFDLSLYTPDLMASINNLGIACRNLGEYEELYGNKSDSDKWYNKAADYFRLSTRARRYVLGAKHAGTLTSRFDLALTYIKLDQVQRALKELTDCYNLRCEVLGENHPRTIKTKEIINRLKQK